MIVKIESKYISQEVELFFSFYKNGTTAIQGLDLNDGDNLFTATVALEEKPSEGCVFLKGWSENEGIPEALQKAEIVSLTGRKISTGFVQAQEAQLLVKI